MRQIDVGPPPNNVTGVTVVLINGNPETAAVWDPLIESLGRDDVVTLSPPGFGATVPDGFNATYDEYVAWLTSALETMGEPVDLLGHDWGANFSLGVACERPDLLRSWVIDTAGCFAPGYSFPEVCHTWQTPGAGDDAIHAWVGLDVATKTMLNESMGMTAAVAKELAAALDERMGQCILGVYRSVPEPVLAAWGQRASAMSARRGLVLIPTEDAHTGTEAQHRWLAEQAGAEVTMLPGLGHWWMLQDPGMAAETLRRFWDGR